VQTSNWSRGLFGTEDLNMRVSDAERQAVADRLAAHYADGRLDQAEFDERSGRAMSAKTRADLSGLLDDLPETPGSLGTGPSGAPGVPAAGAMVRKHSHGHPVLAAALIVIVIISVAHAVFWILGWLWIAVVAVIVLAATGHLGHHHHHDHHPQRVEDDI
jgi:fatty acid desaturase